MIVDNLHFDVTAVLDLLLHVGVGGLWGQDDYGGWYGGVGDHDGGGMTGGFYFGDGLVNGAYAVIYDGCGGGSIGLDVEVTLGFHCNNINNPILLISLCNFG